MPLLRQLHAPFHLATFSEQRGCQCSLYSLLLFVANHGQRLDRLFGGDRLVGDVKIFVISFRRRFSSPFVHGSHPLKKTYFISDVDSRQLDLFPCWLVLLNRATCKSISVLSLSIIPTSTTNLTKQNELTQLYFRCLIKAKITHFIVFTQVFKNICELIWLIRRALSLRTLEEDEPTYHVWHVAKSPPAISSLCYIPALSFQFDQIMLVFLSVPPSDLKLGFLSIMMLPTHSYSYTSNNPGANVYDYLIYNFQ